MKFGNIALFASALASAAFGHVVNIANAQQQQRSIDHEEVPSFLNARSVHDGSAASVLVERVYTVETSGYKMLKAAAGSKKLEKGQQYAMLENGGGLTGHHRVVVGIVAHTESANKATLTYEFANTKYYHVVIDASDTKACCPLSGKWDAATVSGKTYSWLGPVKVGADPQAAGEAYLAKTGKRYNLAAGYCFGGNNCQTYAAGLFNAIKE